MRHSNHGGREKIQFFSLCAHFRAPKTILNLEIWILRDSRLSSGFGILTLGKEYQNNYVQENSFPRKPPTSGCQKRSLNSRRYATVRLSWKGVFSNCKPFRNREHCSDIQCSRLLVWTVLHLKYSTGAKNEEPPCCKSRTKYKI